MKIIKIIAPLAFVLVLTGCSQSTPNVVSDAEPSCASMFPHQDAADKRQETMMREAMRTGVVPAEFVKEGTDMPVIKATLAAFDALCTS